MPPTTKITEHEPGEQQPAGSVNPRNGGTAQPSAETTEMPSTAAPTTEMPAVTPALEAAQATATSAVPEVATPSLGAAAGSDRCASCGAQLAGDQRYCLECGERRGQARFTAPAAATSASAASDRRPPHGGSRWSPGATLIAGVGTLLLALGIGVLIGRSGNSSSPSGSSQKVQVVTVGGVGGAAAAPAATGASATTSTPSSSAGGSSSSHKATKASTNSGSSNSGGSSGGVKTVKVAPPPTVTVGGKCSNNSSGCQNGHFTGNFFGGGG